MSEADTSSANPVALEAFASTAMQLDAHLEVGAVSLRAAIAAFTASCTEYPTGIDESLADQLQDLARRNTELSLWVRQVASDFALADTGQVDPATAPAVVQDPLALYQGLVDGLRSTVPGGPDDLAAGLPGAPITEAALDALVDDPTLLAAAVAPDATGGSSTNTGPLEGLGNLVRSVQTSVTETQAEVRDDLNAVGVAKDQFIADHPLLSQVGADAGGAAVRAVSEPGSTANCEQAKILYWQAAYAAAQDPRDESRQAALGRAEAAMVTACFSKPMAQTKIETPYGSAMGVSAPFDKGAWDAFLGGRDALGHDNPTPGWLSQPGSAASEDLGAVGISATGAADAIATDGAGGTVAADAADGSGVLTQSVRQITQDGTADSTLATLAPDALAQSATRASTAEVQVWADGLPTIPTPTRSVQDLYEIAQTGPTNYVVHAGTETIAADGISVVDGRLLEAKYIDNPARSPFIDDSACPDFIRENARAQVDDEFRRYALALKDARNPVDELAVIVNDERATPYFERLIAKYKINAHIEIRPWTPGDR